MRRSPQVRLFAAVCALLATLAFGHVGASAQGADQQALEQAKSKIASIEDELNSARSRASTAEADLAEAERQLAELEAAVNEIAAALDRQQVAVDTAETRVANLQQEAEEQMDAFARRAADLYKRGVGVPFQALFDAASMDEAIDRSSYVQALNSSDQANLEALVATRTRIDAEREILAAERERLAQVKADHEASLATVEQLRERHALQLAAARNEIQDLQERKEDLEEESARITRLIKARQEAAARAASQPSGEPAVASGAVSTSGYAWPRCARVTSEYGYRWGRRHEGIDIDGNTGDAIFASKAGTVIFAGWHGGYGRMTLIDHGDGVVTAYAHQSSSSVGEGQRVSQGQRIGSVGNTGQSTGSHLHFETRVNGSPVNPRRFLPSSC